MKQKYSVIAWKDNSEERPTKNGNYLVVWWAEHRYIDTMNFTVENGWNTSEGNYPDSRIEDEKIYYWADLKEVEFPSKEERDKQINIKMIKEMENE